MKQIARFTLLSLLTLLTACGKPAFEVMDNSDVIQKSFNVEKTDTNLDFRNTYVITMPNQAPVVIGTLNAHDIQLTLSKDLHTYHLTGTYEILEKGKAERKISTKKFELAGDSRDEHPNLFPSFDDSKQDERVRARLTCLNPEADGTCSKVILDLILKKVGYKENLAAQFEVDLEKNTSVEQKPAAEEVTAAPNVAPASPQENPQPLPTLPTAPSPAPDKKSEPLKLPEISPRPKPAPALPRVKPEDSEYKPNPGSMTTSQQDEMKKALEAEGKKRQAEKESTKEPAKEPAPVPSKDAPNPSPAPTLTLNNEKPEQDEDDEAQGGLYVGTLYQDTDQLFMNGNTKPESKNEEAAPATPSTPATPPKKDGTPVLRPQTPATPLVVKPNTGTSDSSRARDQAVGSAASGRLEHGTSLKEAIQNRQAPVVKLIYPERERFYGTWEIVDTMEKMSNFLSQKENLPGYIMAVGDISQKSGGPLVGSAHKSHQCGLDADIAYPQSDIKALEFNDLVRSGSVSQDLRLKETYQLFEYAQTTLHNVDRIFVDGKIKHALCEMAEKQGMIKSGRAVEVLRRLRPTEGHDNHFHLRIRCSPQQPRCRMMAEPPAGSGCDAAR